MTNVDIVFHNSFRFIDRYYTPPTWASCYIRYVGKDDYGSGTSFSLHPSPPHLMSDEHFSSPFSKWPTSDVYQEQVEGQLHYYPASVVPSKYNGRPVRVIPLEPGTYTWEDPGYCSDHPDIGHTSNYLRITRVQDTGKVIYMWGLFNSRTYKPDGSYWGGVSGGGERMLVDAYASRVSTQCPLLNPFGIEDFVMSSFMFDYTRSLITTLHPERTWGNLCFEASKSIRALDINTLQFGRETLDFARACAALARGDLPKLGKQGKQLIKQLRRTKSLRKTKKLIGKFSSSTYLAWHYGLRLSVADWQQSVNALSAYQDAVSSGQIYQRGSAQISFTIPNVWDTETALCVREVNLIVRSSSDRLLHACDTMQESSHQLSQFIKRDLLEWDLAPSLANLWDMVPFSFVVDWFIPVGDALQRLEDEEYMSTLPVILASYTERWVYSSNAPALEGWVCNDRLDHHIFVRECKPSMEPPIHVGQKLTTDGVGTHVIEGAALLTSLRT